MTNDQIDYALCLFERYVTVQEKNYRLSVDRVESMRAAEARVAEVDRQNIELRGREAATAERQLRGGIHMSVTHAGVTLPNGADGGER